MQVGNWMSIEKIQGMRQTIRTKRKVRRACSLNLQWRTIVWPNERKSQNEQTREIELHIFLAMLRQENREILTVICWIVGIVVAKQHDDSSVFLACPYVLMLDITSKLYVKLPIDINLRTKQQWRKSTKARHGPASRAAPRRQRSAVGGHILLYISWYILHFLQCIESERVIQNRIHSNLVKLMSSRMCKDMICGPRTQPTLAGKATANKKTQSKNCFREKNVTKNSCVNHFSNIVKECSSEVIFAIVEIKMLYAICFEK